MTIPEIEALMDKTFPSWRSFSTITSLGEHDITLRMPVEVATTRRVSRSGPPMNQPIAIERTSNRNIARMAPPPRMAANA